MSSKCREFLSIAGVFTLVCLVTVAVNAGDVSCPTSWLRRNETGDCYFFSSGTADFYSANASCHNMSAMLTSILDSETNEFLLSTINRTDGYGVQFWIGLYRSNETSTNNTLSDKQTGWMWIDGSSFSTTWNDWSPSGNHCCAGLISAERRWRDVDCSTELRYICQQSSETRNHSAVPLTSSSHSPSPDITKSQSNTLSMSTALNSLLTTTNDQPSKPLTTEDIAYSRPSAATERSSDGPATNATQEEGNFTDGGNTLPPVFPGSDWSQPAATTTLYAQEINMTNNGTGPLHDEASIPLLAIYIAVPLAVMVVVVVVAVVACLLCKKFRQKQESASLFWSAQGRIEIINDYENLDSVIGHLEMMSSESSRAGTGVSWLADTRNENVRRPRGPTPMRAAAAYLPIGIGTVPTDEFRQLNEYLLTLKRPLENFVVNDILTDDLKSLISEVSSKVVDIIQQSNERRLASMLPLLHVGARELLCPEFLFLESLISLQLKIATLMRFFPIAGADRCGHSLENMNALLKLAIENVSSASIVRSDCNDVLFETNPLFQELLGRLTLVRIRLDAYSALSFLAEPEDAWKSKLLDCISETGSSILEAFSDVVEYSEVSEPELPVVDDTFRDILEKKLGSFCRSVDGVMPQLKQFLHGINSLAAVYMSAMLDDVTQLATNVLNPRYLTSSRDEESDSTIYQNLVDHYDFPQTVTYHNLPSFVHVTNDDPFVAEFRRYGALADGLAEEDIYEDSTVLNALNRHDDLNSAYSFDEDSFEVVVDRTSPTWLENVFQYYREIPIEQLQRNVKVTFTGEAGLDGGALSREFFFMSFNGLISQPILSHELFEGKRGHLLPAIDHVLTDAKGYWFVGVLAAQAVNKGCKGLPGLCNAVRHFLFSGAKISNITTSLELVTAKDVADLELRAVVTKVLKASELTDEEKLVFETWASDSSFSKVLGPSTHADAVQRIFCHYVFNSRMTQIQAIAEGINDVGLRNRNSVEIERIFPVEEKLTYDDFMSGVVMEPRNSTQRRAREYFRRFCHALHKGHCGSLTLEDLLKFFTGAPYFVSMVGAQVKFAEPEEQNSLPVAHACASELIIPTVHKNYGNFRSAMVKALEYSGTGFGLV